MVASIAFERENPGAIGQGLAAVKKTIHWAFTAPPTEERSQGIGIDWLPAPPDSWTNTTAAVDRSGTSVQGPQGNGAAAAPTTRRLPVAPGSAPDSVREKPGLPTATGLLTHAIPPPPHPPPKST